MTSAFHDLASLRAMAARQGQPPPSSCSASRSAPASMPPSSACSTRCSCGAPAGVEDAARLVSIYTSEFSGATYGLSSYPDFVSVKSSATSFAAIAAVDDNAVENVRLGEFGQSARIAAVSEDYFPALQMRAHRGRLLSPADAPPSPAAAVVSFQSVGTARRRRRSRRKDDRDWRPAILGRWRHAAALSRPSGRARVRRLGSDDRVQPPRAAIGGSRLSPG